MAMLLNTFLFLWYTAANVFIFSLAFNIDADIPRRYGYGLGKPGYLTPSPWIFGVLFIIHLMFAGTILYTQWTEKGNEIVIEELGLQFPLLLVLSTLWAGTWARQLPIPSFIFAVLVCLVSSNIFLRLKRGYPLAADSEMQERALVHIPFSLYHGWTVFILIVNSFTSFGPTWFHSGPVARFFAIWLLATLCGVSVSYAVATKGGDIAGAGVITLGLFAIFFESHHYQPEWMHWATFVLAFISLGAVVKSAVEMSYNIPRIQKAWQIMRQGKPQVALEFKSNVPVLQPDDGQVLVKIKSAALNPVGYKVMKMLPDLIARRPYTAEYDFSGVVVEENNSTRFKLGDEVYGQVAAGVTGGPRGQGALAEYVTLDAVQVAHKPESISFDEAAGLGMAGRTAIDGLVDIAKIHPGQHVFINGGSSGVGSIAVQIAKAYGCTVTASCSGRNMAFVKNLGADKVIDYTISPPHELFVKNPPSPLFDVIFDAVATTTWLFVNCASYLKPDGIFVDTGANSGAHLSWSRTPWLIAGAAQVYLLPSWLGGTNRKHASCNDRPDGRAVPELEKLVEAGKVKGVVDSTHAFGDTLKAYEKLMTGHAAGKVIVKVED
ncbi:hypothetical protein FRB96_000993 [Tulasnella sp. 330]|nr:hypothetical protein FRB96_000993 [Tulasnella sp. 330]